MRPCKSGFILISFLVQLPLMLLVLHLLIYFIRVSNSQNIILSNCYLSSLDVVAHHTQVDLYKLIDEETEKLNSQVGPATHIQFLNQNSNFKLETSNSGTSKLVYNLKFRATIHFFNVSSENIEIERTCGAEKKCINQKCQYGIITDKF